RDEWGLRTPKCKRSGGKPLAESAVYKILTNPFYAGIVIWEGKTYPGKHNPMVTADEFERVQELLGRPGRPKHKKHRFAYTGMIRCGACGLSVTATDTINRHGSRYTYYHCSKRNLRERCRQQYVGVRALEDQILGFLKQISIPDDLHQWAIEGL